MTAFIIFGINFTHLDEGPMQHFTLDPRIMKTWGPGLWTMFIAMIVIIGFLLRNLFVGLHACDQMIKYAALIALSIGGIYLNTKRLAPQGRELHIHHYVMGFLLASFLGYQDPLLTIAHGFCCGMYIEGGVRWGFDPIWPKSPGFARNDPDQEEEDEYITEPGMKREHTRPQRRRYLSIKAHQKAIRAANEKQIAEAIKHGEAPTNIAVTTTASFAPAMQHTYLQPAQITAPVPQLS